MHEAVARPDYYELLLVNRDAPIGAIRASYRRLMQQLRIHPDLGGDTETAALLNKAYAVLSNPDRRSEYDARLGLLQQIAKGVVFGKRSEEHSSVDIRRAPDISRECVFCVFPHNLPTIDDEFATCANCESPLRPAANLRLEPNGNRAVRRINRRGIVRYYTDWRTQQAYAGRTEDISLNGLRMISKHETRPGQRIRVVSDILDAVGNVTHCRERPALWRREFVSGVSFLTLRFHRSTGAFVSQKV